jgi:hypothetical protein
MTQIIKFGTLGGSGIVSTLIIAGIALKILLVSPDLGNLAIGSGIGIGIGIGIILGLLGIAGVFSRVFR